MPIPSSRVSHEPSAYVLGVALSGTALLDAFRCDSKASKLSARYEKSSTNAAIAWSDADDAGVDDGSENGSERI